MKKCKSGCLAKNTQILMGDNTLKCIEDIRPGDTVKTYHGGVARVLDILTGQEEQVIQIKLKDGKALRTTSTHPIMIKGGKWSKASHLRSEDIVCIFNGEAEEIEQIFPTEYRNRVYNLILEGDGQGIYANGIAAGDYSIQCQLR